MGFLKAGALNIACKPFTPGEAGGGELPSDSRTLCHGESVSQSFLEF